MFYKIFHLKSKIKNQVWSLRLLKLLEILNCNPLGIRNQK